MQPTSHAANAGSVGRITAGPRETAAAHGAAAARRELAGV